MVEFLTFFLVLSAGATPIELTVTPPVVRVEVLLDGREVAMLTGAPWAFTCDLGADPEPRELIAIGRDTEGHEVDRTVQWINLGVQPSRARMSFTEDRKGHIRSIGLSWESVGHRRPASIEVTFDGEPVAVSDPRHIPLPSYQQGPAHFVGATVRFKDGRTTRLDASFGGQYGDEVATELTALPVVLAPRTRMPSAKAISSWFVRDGHTLEVQGIEKGPADVLVVRDPVAQVRLEQLADASIAQDRRPMSFSKLRDRAPRPPPGDVAFNGDTHLRFLAPFATPLFARDEVTRDLFARSERHDAEDTGLLWLTHQVRPRHFPAEIADAVAIAGMSAHASSRRRAVVVILDADPNDSSQFSPPAVRRYLRLLRVPLYLWSTAPGARSAWGEATFVGAPPERPGSTERLSAAVRDLDRDLQRQRIVWLKGRHLPEDIELSAAAQGLMSLAGDLP